MTSVWAARDKKLLVLMAASLLLFVAFGAAGLVGYLTQPTTLYPDFFGLWSFARFVRTHPAIQIYDPAALFAYQRQLEQGGDITYTYPYPPPYLLLLWPLGLLSYATARIAWIVVTLVAFLLAVCGLHRRPLLALAATAAPATTICMIYGQNGLLSGALMIGGMRLAQRLPVASGMLLGTLVYKPQLAILVPIALAAAGLWRAFLAAGATVIVLVVISALLFGWDIWWAWGQAIPLHSGLFDATRGRLNHLMPTVAAAGLLAGNAAAAYAAQAVATLLATIFVWRCWRASQAAEALVVLAVATFLATPYAFVYDMPLIAGAVLLLIACRIARNGEFTFMELLSYLLALVLPVGLMSDLDAVGAPLAVASLGLLMWQAARKAAVA